MVTYKVNVWNKCVNFVNEHSEIINTLLGFIWDLANEQATPIVDIQIRPEWATFSDDESAIIDVTILGTSEARFTLLNIVSEVVDAYCELVDEKQQKLIQENIYLQFQYSKENENGD